MLPRRSPGVTVVPSFLPRGLLLLLDVMVNDGRHTTSYYHARRSMMDFPFCGRGSVQPSQRQAGQHVARGGVLPLWRSTNVDGHSAYTETP